MCEYSKKRFLKIKHKSIIYGKKDFLLIKIKFYIKFKYFNHLK